MLLVRCLITAGEANSVVSCRQSLTDTRSLV